MEIPGIGLVTADADFGDDGGTSKEQFKVRVYLAVEQGVTTRDIASRLGISQAAVSKYRIQGEAAFRERQAQV
ncbi:hypothetical protein ACWDWS_04485 [Streptomyces sp. NPDC003328]